MVEWHRSGPEPGEDYEDSWYDMADGVGKITISRPERRNAFRPAAFFELSRGSEVTDDNSPAGVIILTDVRDVFKGKRQPDFATLSRRP